MGLNDSVRKTVFVMPLEEFYCDLCNIYLTTLTRLVDHFNKFHSFVQMSFRCKMCSKVFASLQGIQRHLPECSGPRTEDILG